MQVSRTLDQVGIFSNSIEDAALISEQLIGHDKQDSDTTLNPKPKLLDASKQKPGSECAGEHERATAPLVPRFPAFEKAYTLCNQTVIYALCR